KRAARRHPGARPRRGAGRGGDRRGRRIREAILLRGRGEAGERDPRPHPARGGAVGMSTDESLDRAAELLNRLEAAREERESTDARDEGSGVLGERAELARQMEAELQAAGGGGEGDAGDA